MAKKPNGYEETQEYGGFRELPADGYVCIIKAIEETMSKKGAPMMKVALDIAEGDYKDYFFKQYQSRREQDPMKAKWPNDAIKYVMLEDVSGDRAGQCSRAFKSFCGALEKTGYTVWDEQDNFLINNVKGKTVGCTFGREQSEWNGKTYWHTKPQFFCTVEDIHTGNFNVPDDKALPPLQYAETIPGFAAVEDDCVPF